MNYFVGVNNMVNHFPSIGQRVLSQVWLEMNGYLKGLAL